MEQKQLKVLLSEMSLEEKIDQMVQISHEFFMQGTLTGPAAELGIEQGSAYQMGSALSVIGARTIIEAQNKVLAAQPHKIPMLFMCDIINGYRTVYPIPLAQGCSFDDEMTRKCAHMAAKEATASGVHVTFSPMADLVRDARWGRVMESTGEDVYLNGRMAEATVKGYQGEDLKEAGRMAACLKHFAAYGAPTAGRDYNTVELSERTFLEEYLPAYQRAVDAGCELVMTSFNTNNRIPTSANKGLLRDILRKAWGFEGVVISDWAAVMELIPHGIAKDAFEAARLSVEAGVDIDMATAAYAKSLGSLVEQGILQEELIDEAVLRILELKNKLGLFENPYKDASVEAEERLILCKEHKELAREFAKETFVLLKNDESLLPLSEKEKIAFIGPYVEERKIIGAWSLFAKDEDCVTIREGVDGLLPENAFVYKKGCEMLDNGIMVSGFLGNTENTTSRQTTQDNLKQAMEAAKAADKVVLCLGEPRDFTGEAASRAMLDIPEIQLELLRKIHEVNQNIIVVLFNGRPLDLRELSKKSKAILEVWFPGTCGGNAIAEVLFGKTSPSGKLSMSFPYCVGQVPVFYGEFATGRPFKGDYRTTKFASKYLDIPNEPLYPFGYGLSYSSFSYGPVKLSNNCMTKDTSITASVTLKNAGNYEACEVVQLYLRDLVGSVVRPLRMLKGYERVTLKPGEEREISFTITEDMLRFYDINMNYVSEPGEFLVYIGESSVTENSALFTLL